MASVQRRGGGGAGVGGADGAPLEASPLCRDVLARVKRSAVWSHVSGGSDGVEGSSWSRGDYACAVWDVRYPTDGDVYVVVEWDGEVTAPRLRITAVQRCSATSLGVYTVGSDALGDTVAAILVQQMDTSLLGAVSGAVSDAVRASTASLPLAEFGSSPSMAFGPPLAVSSSSGPSVAFSPPLAVPLVKAEPLVFV